MSAVWKCDKLRQLRVLIVDDNSGDRFLYRQMLEQSDPATDYVFREAECGRAAMEVIREEALDCVLLDYLLPDTVGLDVIRKMAEQGTGTSPPIIMLTGFGDEATAVAALQGGAQGYVSKRDLNGEQLCQAIDRAIKAHKTRLLSDQSRVEMAARNQELERKYQQVEAFYQQILGKFRKPVSALRDHIAELTTEESRPLNDRLQRHLSNLRLESERLVTTMKNLIDNPGLEVGQLLISTRPESIMELVSATASNFRALAEAKNIRLSVKVQPGLPEVEMDRYRIEQVLVNLLDNAIKFTPPRGSVTLNVERRAESPDCVTISVIDSGKGLDPEQLAQLFEPNHVQAPGGSDADQGMGLGLKICREIIQSHQGTITARSLPQAGTCMTVTLPLDSRKKPTAELWEHVTRSSGSVRRSMNA